jgi:bacterial/archaeal transporter family-2 protein
MPQFIVLLGTTLLAVFAGVSFVMRQAVNADLRTALGSAAWAGFISYLGGTLCMLVSALAATRIPRPRYWSKALGGHGAAVFLELYT